MDRLVQLDRLAVTVIIDNETDGLSPPCGCCDPAAAADCTAATYTSEVSRVVSEVKRGSAACLDFRAVCQAGHGYSLLLEAEAGGICHRLLFDGGPNEDLWRRNAASLHVPVGDIEAAVLSHWHIDHSMGLVAAAQEISNARSSSSSSSSNTGVRGPAEASSTTGSSGDGGQQQQPEATAAAAVVFDLHPKRPHCRGLQLKDDTIIPFNCDPELSSLQQPGIDVQLHDEPHTLLDNFFYVSGFIPRVTRYETGNPNHASQWEPDGPWEADEAIADERYVAAAVKGKGVVVFSACSHAGIVNVMQDVKQQTGKAPYGVFGGFHLAPKDLAPRIEPTIHDILELQPALVVAGHCSGWRAKAQLSAALGEHFMPSFVGSRFSIPANMPDSVC